MNGMQSSLIKTLWNEEKIGDFMAFKLTCEKIHDVTIWRCSGDIFRGEATRMLHDLAPQGGCRHLILDLENVTLIDAAGLGTLVHLHNACAERGLEFSILNPSPKVNELIRLTRLGSILPVDESSPIALAVHAIHAA